MLPMEDLGFVCKFALEILNYLLKIILQNRGQFIDEKICIHDQRGSSVRYEKICKGSVWCYASKDNDDPWCMSWLK